MCSRYKLDADPRQLREAYADSEWTAHTIVTYEATAFPKYTMPVLLPEPELKQLKFYSGHWGIFPPQFDQSWDEAKDFLKKYATHNARSETVHTSRLYGKIWEKGQRCIIPMTAFSEWSGEKGKKVALDISGPSKFLSIAGIYSGDMARTSSKCTYSMLTTVPNEFMKDIHNRMPVIIEDIEKWLNPKLSSEEALKMCKPYEGELSVG